VRYATALLRVSIKWKIKMNEGAGCLIFRFVYREGRELHEYELCDSNGPQSGSYIYRPSYRLRRAERADSADMPVKTAAIPIAENCADNGPVPESKTGSQSAEVTLRVRSPA